LIEKLMVLTSGKTSQGVKDYLGNEIIPKGSKFTQKALNEIDFTTVHVTKWTTDAHKNEMIRDVIVNFLKNTKNLMLN
jgi:DNA-directed RNA polymerase subunit beta